MSRGPHQRSLADEVSRLAASVERLEAERTRREAGPRQALADLEAETASLDESVKALEADAALYEHECAEAAEPPALSPRAMLLVPLAVGGYVFATAPTDRAANALSLALLAAFTTFIAGVLRGRK